MSPSPAAGSHKRIQGGLRRLVAQLLRCFWDPLAITRYVRLQAIEQAAGHVRGRVIDIGAGEQPYRAFLSPQVERVVALEYPDPSPKGPIDVWGDVQHLPFSSDVADSVLCFSVLEIVPEPHQAVKEMGRILRPGGKLLLLCAQIRGASSESNDYWRFARPGVARLARAAGLDALELSPCGGLLAAVGQRAAVSVHESLATRRGWPRALVAAVCGLVQAPLWLLDQLGWAADDTLHWLLIARKPPS